MNSRFHEGFLHPYSRLWIEGCLGRSLAFPGPLPRSLRFCVLLRRSVPGWGTTDALGPDGRQGRSQARYGALYPTGATTGRSVARRRVKLFVHWAAARWSDDTCHRSLRPGPDLLRRRRRLRGWGAFAPRYPLDCHKRKSAFSKNLVWRLPAPVQSEKNKN